MAELVRQAGVRIGADQRVGDARRSRRYARASRSAPSAQFSPIENGAACRTEFQNASGVWPDSSAARAVGDGAGDHHRHVDAALVARFGDGVDRGLGVERVEDRLDQQQVGAAVEQAAHLLAIGRAQLVEGDGAEAGIGHVRRDRRGAVGRPEAPATKRGRPSSLSARVRPPRAPAARPREFSS